jgi:hypothetical protein
LFQYRTAVILSQFWISPGHEGVLRLRHVAYVMLCARPRSQKRSDKEMDAGHVRDIASVASYTPLKITRPPRSSKARKATWETPQSGLEITAAPRALSRPASVTRRHTADGAISKMTSDPALTGPACRAPGRQAGQHARRHGPVMPVPRQVRRPCRTALPKAGTATPAPAAYRTRRRIGARAGPARVTFIA